MVYYIIAKIYHKMSNEESIFEYYEVVMSVGRYQIVFIRFGNAPAKKYHLIILKE